MSYISEILRRSTSERAKNCCEYCGLAEVDAFYTHEIDHIYAEKHGGATETTNLCLSCADCNRYKGSDLCSLDPETSEIIRLFHPRRDSWRDHFSIGNNGCILPLSGIERATAQLLHFNDPVRVFERKQLILLGQYSYPPG